MEFPSWITNTLGILAVVIPAVVLIVAAFIRQTNSEWKELAVARGEKIDDLVEDLEAAIARIEKLETKMETLVSFKAEEIADLVIVRLVDMLPSLEEPS